MFVALMNL
jgi:hypothetical protein